MSDYAAFAQLENALTLQKTAFLRYQGASLEERKTNIAKITAMVLANGDAIRSDRQGLRLSSHHFQRSGQGSVACGERGICPFPHRQVDCCRS